MQFHYIRNIVLATACMAALTCSEPSQTSSQNSPTVISGQAANAGMDRFAEIQKAILTRRFASAQALIDQTVDNQITKKPDQRIMLLQASLAIAQQNNAMAEKVLADLRSAGVETPEVFQLLVVVKGQQTDTTEVLEILKEGIEKNPDDVSLHLLLANVWLRNGNLSEAATALHKVMALEPDNPAHPLTLAGLYWDSNSIEKARSLLEGYLADIQDTPKRRLALAEFYLHRDRTDSAEAVLQKGLTKHPLDVALYQGLSRLYSKTSRMEKAIETLDHYLRNPEGKATESISACRLSLAELFAAQHRLDDAARQIEIVLENFPNHLQANYMIGKVALEQNRANRAIAAFQAILQQKTDIPEVYLYLAQAYLQSKDSAGAISILDKGITVLPDNSALFAAQARVHIVRKDFKSAEAAYIQALNLNPTDDVLQAELGDFFLALKEYDRAKREYAEIVNKFPAIDVGYLKLARLYRSQKNPTAALAELERGYRTNPESATLLKELALNLVTVDQTEKAIQLCRDRLKINDHEASTHALLGRIQAHAGKKKEAESSFKMAVELAPRWPEPANQLAALYLREGKEKEAVKNLESALVQNPRNPAAYLTLGRLYEQDLKYKSAMEVYERALETIPNLWVAANNLAILLCQSEDTPGSLQRARNLAMQALRQRPQQPEIVDTFAWVVFQQGQVDQALRLYEKIETKIQDNQLTNYHMAMVLLKAGQLDLARTRLMAALVEKDQFVGRREAEKTLAGLSKNT